MKRRHFLQLLSGAVLAGPLVGHARAGVAPSGLANHPNQPHYDLTKHFTEPVVIEKITLRYGGKKHGMVQVYAKGGAMGMVPTNARLPMMMDLFAKLVAPCFIGQDARRIEALLAEVYAFGRNYKYSGMPFWNCVAHVELAVLDLLGRLVSKPVHSLLAPQPLRTDMDLYLTTFDRENSAEEAVARLQKKLGDTGIRAVKIKVGGRMGTDVVAGRTDAVIRETRKTLGDGYTLYADANSSFDVAEGIRVGKVLEEYNYAIYEEPLPWEDFEGTQAVAAQLRKIELAGGEQDTSFPKWMWYLKHQVLDVLQPDMMYHGGFMRTLQLARMAQPYGVAVTPHSPHEAALQAYLLHFVALVPNTSPYQEYNPSKGELTQWCEPKLVVNHGKMQLPTGPGWGFSYDPAVLARLPVVHSIDKPITD